MNCINNAMQPNCQESGISNYLRCSEKKSLISELVDQNRLQKSKLYQIRILITTISTLKKELQHSLEQRENILKFQTQLLDQLQLRKKDALQSEINSIQKKMLKNKNRITELQFYIEILKHQLQICRTQIQSYEYYGKQSQKIQSSIREYLKDVSTQNQLDVKEDEQSTDLQRRQCSSIKARFNQQEINSDAELSNLHDQIRLLQKQYDASTHHQKESMINMEKFVAQMINLSKLLQKQKEKFDFLNPENNSTRLTNKIIDLEVKIKQKQQRFLNIQTTYIIIMGRKIEIAEKICAHFICQKNIYQKYIERRINLLKILEIKIL